jgi:fido (protein-threonine AMPylation protein)
MTNSPPPWQAHASVDYDSTMANRCSTLLAEITDDPARRKAILADPRDLHRSLFAPFTPPGYSEYAGTYRGTPGTTLAGRRMSSESQLEVGGQFEFCLPDEVPACMNSLLDHMQQWLRDASTDDYGKLLGLSYTFCWFGKIHPFLDGNGHVQRAIFAAMATEFGFPLSARFAIHPRPYDRLLATALEIFTRAPANEENGELALVAEYLAFFLDGPFNAVRKHISTASPYD